jgi:gamma-glutamylcyclotransferase (GGCT)/AIG2-like uncharacterized protein YtfP
MYTGNKDNIVSGTVFELSKEELLRADKYEVDDYKRIAAKLESGCECWIYVAAKDNL